MKVINEGTQSSEVKSGIMRWVNISEPGKKVFVWKVTVSQMDCESSDCVSDGP